MRLFFALKASIQQKEEWARENFEHLKQEFEIIDYFPNETSIDSQWNKESEKRRSWLGAIMLEKDWKKILSITWTEFFKDWWRDLIADGKILIWNMPDKQVKDLIDFIDDNIEEWEKFSIVWHSLGWTLAQIVTVMYADQIEETYTFNAPWARELEVSEKDRNHFPRIKYFDENRDSREISELITNVRWTAWLSFIADSWEDIWMYEINLEKLYSHRIVDLIKYVEVLPINSEELLKSIIKAFNDYNTMER